MAEYIIAQPVPHQWNCRSTAWKERSGVRSAHSPCKKIAAVCIVHSGSESKCDLATEARRKEMIVGFQQPAVTPAETDTYGIIQHVAGKALFEHSPDISAIELDNYVVLITRHIEMSVRTECKIIRFLYSCRGIDQVPVVGFVLFDVVTLTVADVEMTVAAEYDVAEVAKAGGWG